MIHIFKGSSDYCEKGLLDLGTRISTINLFGVHCNDQGERFGWFYFRMVGLQGIRSATVWNTFWSKANKSCCLMRFKIESKGNKICLSVWFGYEIKKSRIFFFYVVTLSNRKDRKDLEKRSSFIGWMGKIIKSLILEVLVFICLLVKQGNTLSRRSDILA